MKMENNFKHTQSEIIIDESGLRGTVGSIGLHTGSFDDGTRAWIADVHGTHVGSKNIEESMANAVLFANAWKMANEIERLKSSNAQLLEALELICSETSDLHPVTIANNAIGETKTDPNQQTEPDYDNPAEREADQRFADAPTPYDP